MTFQEVGNEPPIPPPLSLFRGEARITHEGRDETRRGETRRGETRRDEARRDETRRDEASQSSQSQRCFIAQVSDEWTIGWGASVLPSHVSQYLTTIGGWLVTNCEAQNTQNEDLVDLRRRRCVSQPTEKDKYRHRNLVCETTNWRATWCEEAMEAMEALFTHPIATSFTYITSTCISDALHPPTASLPECPPLQQNDAPTTGRQQHQHQHQPRFHTSIPPRFHASTRPRGVRREKATASARIYSIHKTGVTHTSSAAINKSTSCPPQPINLSRLLCPLLHPTNKPSTRINTNHATRCTPSIIHTQLFIAPSALRHNIRIEQSAVKASIRPTSHHHCSPLSPMSALPIGCPLSAVRCPLPVCVPVCLPVPASPPPNTPPHTTQPRLLITPQRCHCQRRLSLLWQRRRGV
ncbi:hypothetical protein TcWFU_008550 [Taenia crassiceps]|uniref:Uncharacterized protein n=1 Tax=Taenia crassiceps TaxID=6207 RepID=A0ABR4Q897_9CEST